MGIHYWQHAGNMLRTIRLFLLQLETFSKTVLLLLSLPLLGFTRSAARAYPRSINSYLVIDFTTVLVTLSRTVDIITSMHGNNSVTSSESTFFSSLILSELSEK